MDTDSCDFICRLMVQNFKLYFAIYEVKAKKYKNLRGSLAHITTTENVLVKQLT